MTSYAAVGTTDENTTCDCCGKSNLKMTVVLKDDEGNFHFFGRSCASRATGWKAAYLERRVIEANNKRDRARELADRLGAYLADGERGLTRFITNNWVACGHKPREDSAEWLRANYDKAMVEAGMPVHN